MPGCFANTRARYVSVLPGANSATGSNRITWPSIFAPTVPSATGVMPGGTVAVTAICR